MQFKYLDMKINYQQEGSGDPIILLHGWGSNLYTFEALAQILKKKYLVYRIDLPGFGMSDQMTNPFSLDDYCSFLKAFTAENQIENPILFGHSFGGKIIIRYVAEGNSCNKIILVDSAGIRHHLGLIQKLSIYYFKTRKWWYRLTKNESAYQRLYETSGSEDYRNANMVMKATLSKIVRVDLRKDLKKIKQEVLLVWGKLDATTPYSDAKLMQKFLNNSGLVTFDEAGHFPYLEERRRFIKVIESYLGIDEESENELK